MHDQRVAVRRAFRHERAGDGAGRAGAVFHDVILAMRFGEFLRNQARQHIGGTARGKRHDHSHSLGGIVLRGSRPCRRCEKKNQQCGKVAVYDAVHVFSPPVQGISMKRFQHHFLHSGTVSPHWNAVNGGTAGQRRWRAQQRLLWQNRPRIHKERIMSNIGFIGLGIMGKPMAANLIKGGHTLFLTSRSGVAKELTDAGGKACASAKEVAQKADIIIIMVPDTPDVEKVLFGANGVAEGF